MDLLNSFLLLLKAEKINDVVACASRFGKVEFLTSSSICIIFRNDLKMVLIFEKS
jgi:hypothetical protein